jgi:hypothetical protein
VKDKRDVLGTIKSREIVKEIIDFGVSEFQIKKIIKFLSLELEDRDTMVKILSLVDENFTESDGIKPKIKV